MMCFYEGFEGSYEGSKRFVKVSTGLLYRASKRILCGQFSKLGFLLGPQYCYGTLNRRGPKRDRTCVSVKALKV